jgi:hypothetical protein
MLAFGRQVNFELILSPPHSIWLLEGPAWNEELERPREDNKIYLLRFF